MSESTREEAEREGAAEEGVAKVAARLAPLEDKRESMHYLRMETHVEWAHNLCTSCYGANTSLWT